MDAELLVKKHKRKRILIIVIVVVVAALAAYYFLVMRPGLQAANTQTTMPETQVLAKQDLQQVVSATGSFQSQTSRTVASSQNYNVTAVYVEVGEKVGAGQALAQLDTTDIDQQIADVMKSLQEATESDDLSLKQAEGKRDRALLEYVGAAKGTTEDQLKQLEDAYRSAQESVDSLQLRDSGSSSRTQLRTLQESRDDCLITAPISGTVTSVTAEVGLSASAGATQSGTTGTGLFVIQDMTHLEVPATVAEYDAVTLSPGLSVNIYSDTFEDQTFPGTVKSISPVATDTSGGFTVTVTLDGDAMDIKPGMTAKMEIIVQSKSDVYAVPYDAVVEKPDGTKVVYALEGASGRVFTGGTTGEGKQARTDGATDGGSGEAPVVISGEAPEGGFPGGSGEMPSGGFPGGSATAGSGTAGATADRIEIEVTTGMETDYLVEISGDGLSDGLLILTDPQGVSVGSSSANNMMMIGGPAMGGGGGAVRVERRG
ncbi:MAG: efflux RND transporter periplasmic adaptor subunit [Clostridiales Family XIII bacterium]|jgi:RND family efflux transporter MFP subunit|nr:efflux RND transporter periplasmic adaptor subunit [Clostridiales Family XIII bacterium]